MPTATLEFTSGSRTVLNNLRQGSQVTRQKRTKGVGLSAKFALVSSLVLLLTFVALSFVMITLHTSFLRGNLSEQAKSYADLATKPIGGTFITYKNSGQLQIQKELNSIIKTTRYVKDISIYSVDGKQLYSLNPDSPVELAGKADVFEPAYISDNSGLVKQVIAPVIEPSGAHRYAVVYDVDSSEITNQISKEVNIVLLIFSIALILTIASSYGAVNLFIIAPVKKVIKEANLIGNGDLDRVIEVNTRDELGEMAASVNKMAANLRSDIEKLRESDEIKSEFMMIVSHNLRTPLTLIKNYLEMLKDAHEAERQNYMDGIDEGTKRLGKFVEEILVVTELESGQKAFQSTQLVDLDKFLADIVKDFKPIAEYSGIELKTDIKDLKRRSPISELHMKMAVWNILDNAVKFTKDKAGEDKRVVKLSLSANDKNAQIIITDSGAGIAKDQIDKVFTKFHRATSTLEYNYEGYGISLYTTRMIIERHKGFIEITSELGKGSEFTINLPLLPADVKWQFDQDSNNTLSP